MSRRYVWTAIVVFLAVLSAITLFAVSKGRTTAAEKASITDAERTGIERKPEAGFKAPELSLEKLLQAPEGTEANWDALRGKVVVLEFWGTWCGACILEIPRINELAERFKDEPVQFISVTFEDESTVLPFLKKKAINTWIGLDTDRSMVQSYGVKGWPHTVIVNKEGMISAVTHPAMLTAGILKDVLAGKTISIQDDSYGEASNLLREADLSEAAFPMVAGVDRHGEPPPVFRVLIRPPEFEHNSGCTTSGGRFTGRNITFDRIVSNVFGISPSRIVCPSSLSSSRYDVVINIPHGKEDLAKPLLEQILELTFGVTFSEDEREMSVCVVSRSPRDSAVMRESDLMGGMRSKHGEIIVSGQPIRVLWNYLESYLDRPVVDETDLKGRYDFELTWDSNEPNSIVDAMHKQLGLEVKQENRYIEVLIVNK